MVLVNQPMVFQAEVPPTSERDPSNPNQVMIYSPSGQPVSLTLPATATPGSKLTYDITYGTNGVPVANVVAAPTPQQLAQAKAFDKIAELGDEEEFATANYHPEGAEKLFDVPQQQSQMRVVCPQGSYPGSQIAITTPTGQSFQTTVPVGVSPGMQFLVNLPPPTSFGGTAPALDPNALKSGLFLKDAQELGWGAQMQQMQQQTHVVTQQQHQQMNVTIPSGVSAGGQFLINTPSGQQMTVTAPPGTNAGDTIVVNVPIQMNATAPPASNTNVTVTTVTVDGVDSKPSFL